MAASADFIRWETRTPTPMAELHHECGIAAIYQLPGESSGRPSPPQGPGAVSRWIPRLLLDIQNRGQLAAGLTS